MYADYIYYIEHGGTASEQEIAPKLQTASDNVDALTFYRINGIGWDALTEFQQSQICKACVVQADFLLENADAVQSAIDKYSINGVTVEFGNASLYSVLGGVPFSNAALKLLEATGLTTRMALSREVEPCYIHD